MQPMRTEEVTIWSLEMRGPEQLRAVRAPGAGLTVRRAELPSPELSRFFYTAIGGDWYWIDRLSWDYEDWMRWVARRGHETWTAWLQGAPAGYFELGPKEAGSIEIAFFGLLAAFTGRRLGGHLLTCAAERAWARGAQRVWLHTCSLDAPHALANYEARGFRRFSEETRVVRVPEAPPGPWPGARSGPTRAAS